MSKVEKKEEAPFYKSEHYFDLSNATDDVSIASGAKDTATALAKLAGKSIFNVGLLAGKTSFFVAKEAVRNGPSIVANLAETNLKTNGHKMTDEQREKTEAYVRDNKGKKTF